MSSLSESKIGEVVALRRGRVGCIVINRAKALNSLDLPMFSEIFDVLGAWRDDPQIEAVVIRGAGSSFSAGGDIRAVRAAALAGDEGYNARLYFAEYRTNALIARYPKPYVAAIDGYCMGGGLGLAMHGTYRLVSERAVLAMPEVGIGFFPDVGASYVFPRLADRIGWYAGLTGARLSAWDALGYGLATHLVCDDDLARIEDIVASRSGASLAERLRAISRPAGCSREVARRSERSELDLHRATIARCFGRPSLAGVLDALLDDPNPWAQHVLAALRRASPTSVALTFELFRRGAALEREACLEMDYQLARRLCLTREFQEGVRAMVVDKDRSPKWDPARIEDVSASALDDLWAHIDIARDELAIRLHP